MAEKEYYLNGIRFTSAIEYQNAKKEQEGIAYITEKNDMSDDMVVLALYNKFVQKNVFRTQIGYEFLKGLQERLMRSEKVDKSQVARLPIYEEKEEVVLDASAVKVVDEPAKKQPVQAGVSNGKTNAAGRVTKTSKPVAGKASSGAKSNIHFEYTTGKPKQSVADKKLAEYKSKYGWSLFVNIVLVLIIIAMVYITLNSNNINILKYEEKLQNEYAAWAEELAAKEAELGRREHELNSKTDN